MSDNIRQNIIDTVFTSSVKTNLAARLIQSWSLSGKLRSTTFIHKLVSKGMITLSSPLNIIPSIRVNDFCTVIDSIITIMNRMYEKNWDFHLEPVFANGNLKCFKLTVKILFPEVLITNTNEDTHTIKDIIVHFDLKKSDFHAGSYCPRTIKGTRATLSFEEWFIGYNHSHLTTYQPKGFSNTFYLQDFCTGSNTEINNVALGLNESGFSEELFELYLYTINTLVSWESIEGTPFKRMNTITPVNQETYRPPLNPTEQNMLDTYKSLHLDFSGLIFNYHYNDNRFRVKKDSLFSDFVKDNIVRTGYNNTIRNYIVKQINTTMYGYSISEATVNPSFINNKTKELPYTLFQGRKVYFKLEKFTGDIPDINEYKTHPKFLNYVANKLEQQLFYSAVRKNTIERQHQSSNA